MDRRSASALVAATGLVTLTSLTTADEPPNVILIFCDDLGYNDLGCYGSTTNLTPNIDLLAAEGTRFSDFYSVCSVCTPSRAALLTGRYPDRSGLGNGVLFPGADTGIPAEEYTLGEAFQDIGYRTACVGKWHLGDREDYLPTQHGFDYYYGIPYSNDMEPCYVLENTTVVEEAPADQTTLTQRYTQKALTFMEHTHRSAERFFLYLPHTFAHVPLHVSPPFDHNANGAEYAEVVEEIDWSVGRLLAKLNELNIRDETLVILTSDNGPWLDQGADGGSADPLREGKGTVYEGGVRVPTLARWPGKIPRERVESRPAAMVDWFPTLTSLCGSTMKTDRAYDGRDLSAMLLRGEARADSEIFLYSSRAGARAYRSGAWKLHADGEPALYDLSADISERNDLRAANTETFRRMRANLEWFRSTFAWADSPGDIDGDRMPDAYETVHGLDPCYAIDAISDADGDGVPSLEEFQRGTLPDDANSFPGPRNVTVLWAKPTYITLVWDPSDLVGPRGYSVYRSESVELVASEETLVASGIEVHGYVDTGLAEDTTYRYVVTLFNPNGIESTPSIPVVGTTGVSIDDGSPPLVYVSQNYPNPFHPSFIHTTKIAFGLRSPALVELRIVDPSGRLVRTLVDRRHEEGYYTVEWDGRNESGQQVSSGVYLYKVVSERFVETRKMLLIK